MRITPSEGCTTDIKKVLYKALAQTLNVELSIRLEDAFLNLVEVKRRTGRLATASRNTPKGYYSPTFVEMLRRLFTAAEQSRSAKTVEVFGWLILIEGTLVLFVPRVVASVLQIPPLEEQSANYFRLVGLLVAGLGLLYIVSGRVNSRGFVFASMLDRPLVPLAMAILWYFRIVPGPLALIFSVQDFASFLWTLVTWRGEQQA